MLTKTNRIAACLAPMIAAILLTGCRVGPAYRVPAATQQTPPGAYKEAPAANSDGWKVAQPQDAMLRGKWWQIYNQPELNDLEDKLAIDNQNIKVSFNTFMAARALIAQARAQLYPTLAAAPSYSRSRSSSNATGTGAQNSLTTLPLSASWEPDLWGKVRNAIREEQANAQLSAADLENERLTEQATLAIVYFELRGQDDLEDLYKATVEADREAVTIALASHDTGVGDQVTVVQAQNTLHTAESALTNLGVARAQEEHAIALLIGANASTFSLPRKALTATPPPIPIGLPSQLLERRPDIAAAERAMAAANAQIGVAVAAFYPNLTLSAEGGLQSSTLQHLFEWPSRFWSVGPSVSETIFDAGLRRATVNQYVATYNADVATYRQTVLTAFQQVEDDLAAVRILSQQIEQLQAAEASANEYFELENSRYRTGIDPYANVIAAKIAWLNDQQSLASLRIQQMTASVQLIEALGGGWDRSQLPTAEQVSSKIARTEIVIEK